MTEGLRGVGAAGNGGDDDRTVVEIEIGIDVEAILDCRGDVRAGAFSATAASATASRCHTAAVREPSGLAVGASSAGQLLRKAGGCILQQHAILRALGPGHAGLDGGEVEFEGLRVLGFGRAGGAEEALVLVVGLDEVDLFFAAAGEAQIAQGFCIDGEDAAGGAVFGGHVADGGAVGQRQCGDAGAVELDELADDA